MWQIYHFYSALPISAPFIIILFGGSILLYYFPSISRYNPNTFVNIIVTILVIIVLGQYLFWTVRYLFIPIYYDNVEPTIAVTTELLLRGQQIYPSSGDGDRLYGMIYGPILYFIHACFISATKSIFSTKLAGVLAIWGALILITLEVKRLTRSAHTALLALSCVVIFFDQFGIEVFWNRPEPFLIFLSAAAIRSLHLSRYRAVVVLGILSGIASNLKIYTIVLFVPMLIMLMLREKTIVNSLRIGILIGAVAALVAIAPFLDPNVSLRGYIEYLYIAAHHGFSIQDFYTNINYVLIIAAPTIFIYGLRRPIWSKKFQWMALAFLASILVVAFMGSKHGAGAAYLLPSLPIALYLTTVAAVSVARRKSPEIGERAGPLYLFILLLLGLGPYEIPYASRINQMIDESQSVQSQIDELTQIFSAYPQAEMGASDLSNYPPTYYRVVGILKGTPVHLEIPYLMDLRASGISSAVTEALVKNCKVAEWILPVKGVPFSIKSYGKAQELFSDQFRQDFIRSYRVVFKGQYYNVWSCWDRA